MSGYIIIFSLKYAYMYIYIYVCMHTFLYLCMYGRIDALIYRRSSKFYCNYGLFFTFIVFAIVANIYYLHFYIANKNSWIMPNSCIID